MPAPDAGQKALVTEARLALQQVIGDWKPHNIIEHLFKGRVEKWDGDQGNTAGTAGPALVFVFFAGLPLWVLLAACVIGADPPSVGLSRPRSLTSRLAEVFGDFLGWATMLPVAVLFAVAHALMQPPYSIDRPGKPSGWRLLDGLLKFTRFQSWAHFGSFVLFVTLVLVLLIAVASLYKKIPPGLGICVLLCLASVVYLCLDVLLPGVRAVVVLLMGEHSCGSTAGPTVIAFPECPGITNRRLIWRAKTRKWRKGSFRRVRAKMMKSLPCYSMIGRCSSGG